jgi:hypothetical protein
MDIFFFQLVIIFIPGIIWERIDAQYGSNRATQQWDILRRSFVFGLAAYLVTFCAYWLASFFVPGLNFQLFQFKKDVEFLDAASVKLIFAASLVSMVCSRPPISPRHSTVTDLARLRGWSTSVPIATAVW